MQRKLIILILILASAAVRAQVTVEARLSAVEMLIGQQVTVTLSAIAAKDANVAFPETAQLPTGIELLDAVVLDDVEEADGLLRRQRQFVLTSFHDTLYYIPPMAVKVDGKDYLTNKLALKVLTIEVDTTETAVAKPPKGVQDNPFDWNDWKPAFWLSLVMLLLLAIDFYLFVQLKTGKPILPFVRVVKRVPPHTKAMEEIASIRDEHIVTQEENDEYYTRLTSAIRRYIEERYNFKAMAMTSDEIIDYLLAHGDATMLSELRTLFETADLVKFANYSTMLNENDANLMKAVSYIDKTKQENLPTEVVEKRELTDSERRTVKERRVLRVVVAVLGIVAVVLFGCVVYLIVV